MLPWPAAGGRAGAGLPVGAGVGAGADRLLPRGPDLAVPGGQVPADAGQLALQGAYLRFDGGQPRIVLRGGGLRRQGSGQAAGQGSSSRTCHHRAGPSTISRSCPAPATVE